MRFHPAVAACALLAGCATSAVPELSGVDALLIGEQHDASAHPGLHERWVASLADRGRLAAVAIEMAERGTTTAGLPASASESQVQEALRWNAQGWPWPRYRPAVMAAVRAGVPVLGANLPRDQQRAAMQDRSLDQLLPGPALKAQQQAVRLGHCELLPESQITPMTRVQIARDVAMAQTITAATQPGKTVVLLAGAGHVQEDVGVPRHLPRAVRAKSLPLPAEETGKDYCEEFRKQMPAGMPSRS
ncbi:ChaN family lipoprotein [Ramlibacter sp. USB13]|uniref:ChaN family lipoprotein n=1 Tax=Ramlibacter cellulosilyticus TaxID=2764187 RepID=A0A923SAJ8_9BURK|nr:ChaN family lipoprotein [Ramlibacter cellulosilyticus]MBC5782861.1 ChaN family lipoprotein [Ramlibacter cellulosilyticus]